MRQTMTAEQSYRFFNSETHYSARQALHLVRALQHITPEHREKFFVALRRCRRRPQIPVSQLTSLANVINTIDESQMVLLRAVRTRVQSILKERGLWTFDAFNTIFDRNRTGFVSYADFARGLNKLGLRLEDDEVACRFT